MVTASEFVDLNCGESDEERVAEKQRIARLVKSLPQYPQEARKVLAEEFLKIIADPNEAFSRKVQATSMLAFQAKRLGGKGATPFACAVCEVLDKEFGRVVAKSAHQTNGSSNEKVKKLRGTDRLLLGNLVAAALFIDYETAKPTVGRVLDLLGDEHASMHIKSLIEAAERSREC